MKSIIIKLLTLIVIASSCLFSIASVTPVFADDSDPICGSNVAPEVKKANGCTTTGDKLPNVVTLILNTVIGISGLVAVVFIIIGGVSYMTAAGDVGKAKKAKDTILYAVVGMVICVLAFAIVNWVIGGVLQQE